MHYDAYSVATVDVAALDLPEATRYQSSNQTSCRQVKVVASWLPLDDSSCSIAGQTLKSLVVSSVATARLIRRRFAATVRFSH